MPSEISIDDFRQVVELLHSAIKDMKELADRVKALEEANDASYKAAVALKDTQLQLFEMQKGQQEVLGLMKQSLDQLLAAVGGNVRIVN